MVLATSFTLDVRDNQRIAWLVDRGDRRVGRRSVGMCPGRGGSG